MLVLKTSILFLVTAIAEITGCYLSFLWLKEGRSIWLLLPAAFSLVIFTWLLTLHGTNAGRTYAAYGGVYISVALLWMWLVEGQGPDLWDVVGVILTLVGSGVIFFSPHK
jgi:small multidrug resistance family-3 protein